MTCEDDIPVEIITNIVSHLSRTNSKFPPPPNHYVRNCMLVSKKWYSASISQLYFEPGVTSGNVDRFVDTICSKENAAHERARQLGSMVRHLCLENTNSFMRRSPIPFDRLLHQVKDNLEGFKSSGLPIDNFYAIRECKKLFILDLSEIENKNTYEMLFQIIRSLPDLRKLFLPPFFHNNRETPGNKKDSSGELMTWPPRLKEIHIIHHRCLVDETIHDLFSFDYLFNVPKTLSRLNIEYFFRVPAGHLNSLLLQIGSQLTHLVLDLEIQTAITGILDSTLRICPSLVYLLIYEDYITEKFFEDLPVNQKLRRLDLEKASETFGKISPETILGTIYSGRLLDLRKVNYCNLLLNWAHSEESNSFIQALSDAIDYLEAENPFYEPCGVTKFKSRRPTIAEMNEYDREADFYYML